MTSGEQQEALLRSQTGDADAQGKLLESYRLYITCIARALQKARALPRFEESDLIQEVLLEAHRSFPSFRGETVAVFTGWVRQIAIRTLGRQLQRSRGLGDLGHELDDLAAPDSSPSDQAIRHEETAQVIAALACLPQDMQEVLLGRHLHEWSYAEMAQAQGRSEGALRVLYLRALRRLQEEAGKTSRV